MTPLTIQNLVKRSQAAAFAGLLGIGLLMIGITQFACAADQPRLVQPANITQKQISIDMSTDNLAGVFTRPITGTALPAIIILNGFAPERDGIPIKSTQDGMFSRPAKQWAEHGYASLRISTRGTGGSSGRFEDITIERRIEEATAAVGWLRRQPDIDGSRIGIVGYNQGAIVAAAVAGRLNKGREIKSIALWMPIVDPLFYYANRSGLSQMTRGLHARPEEIVPLTTRSTIQRQLKRDFYKDIWTMSPAAELTPFAGSMLVAMGEREKEDVPTALSESLFRYHHGRHELISLQTDQSIGVFEGPDILDDLAGRTLAWFQTQL
jgi:alpha/beta superfamily hydrolase